MLVTLIRSWLPVEPAIASSASAVRSAPNSLSIVSRTSSRIVTLSLSETGWVAFGVSSASANAVFVRTTPSSRSASTL